MSASPPTSRTIRRMYVSGPQNSDNKNRKSLGAAAAADWQTCNSGEIFNSLSFPPPRGNIQYHNGSWHSHPQCINTPEREWKLPANYAIYNPCVGTMWANSIGWRKCEIYVYFAKLSTRKKWDDRCFVSHCWLLVTLFVARMWMSIFITQCIWWYSLSDRQKPISLGGGWCCLVEQTTFSRDDLLTAQDPFSEHYSTLYFYRGLSVAPLTFVLFRRAIIIDFVNYDTRMPLAHYPLFHLLSLLSS